MDGLKRYNILQEIDSGGMATVYLAEDTVLHRRVALKMVHPHLLHRPETVKRFHNEARVVAALSHENIVKVYDYGEEGEKHYLVMEYIEGVTLAELIDRHAPLPNLVLLELIYQILAGLCVAHEKGVYHRDVKPGNIMVDLHGCVRIMDFGIAYLVSHESITLTGTFVGSPNYISPEQAQGQKITGKTDIFSLGALAYQGATGLLPFDAENPHAIIRGIVNDEPVSPHRHVSGLLDVLSDFTLACLAKDESLRPTALDCLSRIDSMCSRDHLELGRGRVVRFLREPARYRDLEDTELSQIYRRRAREEFGRRNVVGALKMLNQAKAFGGLSATDERWARSLGRRMRVRRVVLFAGVSAGVLGLVLVGVLGFGKEGAISGEVRPGAVGGTASVESIATTEAEDKRAVHPPKAPEALHAENAPRTAPNAPGSEPSDEKGNPPVMVDRKGVATKTTDRGYLSIRTKPSWVTIVIDGMEAGNTAKVSTIPLMPGPHELILRKEGFRERRDMLHVTPGDTLRRKVLMEPFDKGLDSRLDR